MDYVTRLDTYLLDILTVSDNFSFSIALHEYPFTSKNKLEHIGEKTRRIQISCVFTQNPTTSRGWDLGGEEPTYANHYKFIKHIKKSTTFTFVHPKYGQLEGLIPNISVTQDDTVEYAAITFTFLVQTSDAPNYEKPLEALQAKDFTWTVNKVLGNISANKKAFPNTAAWTGQAQQLINTLDAFANYITTPATSLANTIYYAADVPSQLVESMSMAVDRAMQPIIASYTAPAATINSMVLAQRSLVASLQSAYPDPETTYAIISLRSLAGSRLSYEASVIYENDNKVSGDQRKQENQPVFDPSGNFIGSTEFVEVMTIDELDATAYDTKSFMDESIQDDREQKALKSQGAALQQYVNRIKLERERIATEEDVPLQSMHQIALEGDLPYQRVEQLLKLNPRITNPTFSSGEIRILTRD